MLTLWKAVSICLTSGKKKTNKYAMLHHESNHISTSIFFFNVMSGKASVTLIGGHSVISLSSDRAFTRLQLVFGTIPSQFWTEI